MPRLYDHEDDRRRAYPLERGWVRHKLIRELAAGNKTQRLLAEEYGVSEVSVSKFKSRHQTAIDEARVELEDEMSSLWIANKAMRLAELQDDVDNIGVTVDAELMAVKHKALLQASQELGQLPGRANVVVNTAPVTYKIEGVDLESLR